MVHAFDASIQVNASMQVNTLLESSAESAVAGDAVMALERAKEAGRKERQLTKFREAKRMTDSINVDLTYCVCFNLANAYAMNNMFQEALNTYTLIVKNKTYLTAGRLRVNMGNVYFAQGNFTSAIKMYRMALDQVAGTNGELKLRILRNIGVAFIKLQQYPDAISTLESIMGTAPDFQTAFNLIVCYYARGDTDTMKTAFDKLLQIPPVALEGEEDDGGLGLEESVDSGTLARQRDALATQLRHVRRQSDDYIMTASKLIAPTLYPGDWERGYEWVIDRLRVDYDVLASEMAIVKALTYLKHKSFDKAIEDLKAFEKKDQNLKAKAATNLSFLYFLEGDQEQAHKYADLAVRHDRYNARALVNMGNCLVEAGELDRAKEMYLEAIGVEADCVEAIFNLGLVNKQLGAYHEALQAYEKLHTLVPSSPEVIYHLASLHESMQSYGEATKYFQLLVSRVPSDAGALARLGGIFAQDADDTQAFHYQNESCRYLPSNLDVVSWLGIWYVKSELYEKAIDFFRRAAEIQPKEVKWQLMVGSCYRRLAQYMMALDLYKRIHDKFPENVECLTYLVALAREQGLEFAPWESKLLKLERAVTMQQSMLHGGGGGGDMSPGSISDSGDYGYGAGPPGYDSPPRAGGGDMYAGALDDGLPARGGGALSMDSPGQPTAGGFSAPQERAVATGAGVGGNSKEEDFGDADLDDLLVE
jgi:intraflagellar transport protein 88